MEFFANNDSEWNILGKILRNQTAIAAAQQYGPLTGLLDPSVRPVTAPDITVDVAGTRKQGPVMSCPRGVEICGRSGNTGNVYIGDDTVTNASGSKQGYVLVSAGVTPFRWAITNLSQLFVNADVAGEGISVTIL